MTDSNYFNESYKKVSVIVPNYNYANFLEERIFSVAHQTFPIYELIILDDASTDNSVEVINDCAKQISNIPVKVIQNEYNSGCVFKQWAKGLEMIKGDYFWIAEADDSSDIHFLETLMRGFDDEEVVLSYCDSKRIDENGKTIRRNSQDLYNMVQSKHWDHDYINNGTDEIINYLSVTNTILNVSGIVWKYKDYFDIFRKAEDFKVAGDWYIYVNVLEQGKIAFFKKPLNFFRKHKRSVSTVVKCDQEFSEICFIQDYIREKYDLSIDILNYQRKRRCFMENEVSKNLRKKKIAWFLPSFGPGGGGGGHRTILQNINALVKHGYDCDMYVEDDGIYSLNDVKSSIYKNYGECAANIYLTSNEIQEYDLIFLTGWQVIDTVKKVKCEKKAYFIQDFEPWFFPMGSEYLMIEDSYRLGYNCITIGKWLAHKLSEEFQQNVQHFDFCADLNIYHQLENIQKENAICYIYQPEKPRRCDEIALKALRYVKKKRPDIKIYFYGSNTHADIDYSVEQLGVISLDKCNELYNKCRIGLCMSASNPSRIPFEMMAAGLPVIELYRENNLYDFPDNAVRLVQSSPLEIANAIISLIDDQDKLNKMSINGVMYMKDYPLDKGFIQFVNSVDQIINDEFNGEKCIERSYRKELTKFLDFIDDIEDTKLIQPNKKVSKMTKIYKLTRFKAGKLLRMVGLKK